MFLSVFLLLLKASAHIKVIILMLFLPRIQVRKFLSCARMVSMHLAPFLDVSALPSPFLQPLPQLFTILIIHCKYITKKKMFTGFRSTLICPKVVISKPGKEKRKEIFIFPGARMKEHILKQAFQSLSGISVAVFNLSI